MGITTQNIPQIVMSIDSTHGANVGLIGVIAMGIDGRKENAG
jgi:hypothetical protein